VNTTVSRFVSRAPTVGRLPVFELSKLEIPGGVFVIEGGAVPIITGVAGGYEARVSVRFGVSSGGMGHVDAAIVARAFSGPNSFCDRVCVSILDGPPRATLPPELFVGLLRPGEARRVSIKLNLDEVQHVKAMAPGVTLESPHVSVAFGGLGASDQHVELIFTAVSAGEVDCSLQIAIGTATLEFHVSGLVAEVQ